MAPVFAAPGFYGIFILWAVPAHSVFTQHALFGNANVGSWEFYMLDVLIVVLGTGGILLMAAYAVLCDRI